MDIDKEQREQLKSWMRRYKELQEDATRFWDRLDDLRGRVEAARTSHLDGMPHGSRSDADRIGGIIAELEELELEATEAQQEATAARREIAGAIKQLHGPRWADRREVLRLRYLDGLRWEDVTERLFGDSQDFWDRQDVFLRRSFKLHSQALEELAQYVPLPAGQEVDTETEDKKHEYF